jgi:hypothetical protein
MRLYSAICEAIEALADALTAWADSERTNTLEHEFEQADWNND